MPVHANDDQEIAQATPRKRQRMSLDLRRQIVALRDEDLCTFREITDYLDVPVATAHNVCTKFRETGIIEPRASKPPNRTVVTREMEEFLAEEIDKDCAVTNGMLADKLHEKFDVKVNATTIGRHVKRMGIDFKMIYEQVTRKNSMVVKMKRQEWFQDLANANIPQSRIFYVDECGFNINMHRSRGRAPKGKRAIKNVDSIRAPNWTLICVIGDTGVVHYDIHHGPVNQHVFQRTMVKFIHVLELEPHTAGDSFRDDEDHGASDDEHDSDQAPEQELEDEGSAKYVEFHGKVLSAVEPSQSEHNNSNHTHHHHNHNNNSSSSAPAPSSSSAPAPPSTGAGTSMQHAGPSAQHAGTLTQHAAASSTSDRAADGVSLHAQQRTQPRDTHAASELLRRRRGRLPRGHHRSTAFTDDIQDEDNSADDVGQWSSAAAAAAASHPASSTGTSSLRHPMRTRRLQQLVQPSSQTSARAAAPRRTSTYTYPPAVEALWTNDADDDDDDDDDDDEEAYHPSQAECFQDEAEEGNDNADLLIASEEKYGRSFPRDGRTYKAWIVMDNASFHKTASLRNYFWRRNYRLLYLPPYSSFLNPIEYVFGKIKSCFKRTPLKKGEKVHRRIEDAVRQVSAQNCSRSIVHVSKYAFPCAQLEDIKD
ncbi:hypothetical protein CAOG_09150 [Capsaspora owczarzaki ATCC 30864]|uniref:hypothetical protein n=1 Tax=Capsaspora owczarzaki (strain ATCC 30864) TaxID=595528 RepID=UPI0003522E92|nr:hypothetical protein CAOG_09150 [Capsaspora owczarzaki ATCC 30864]|eukprot:XP_011270863.1 hypothetical protein CAOG_09150 [Capsaspora owczarzaki ATCC 30864]